MKMSFFWAILMASVQVFAFQNKGADTYTPQMIRIADLVQVDLDLEDNYTKGGNAKKQHVITAPGASFIKVHFEYFSIPEGYLVEVSNPNGTEVYRYENRERDDFTFDETLGEDGFTRFASMSITGDTAVVTLHNMNEEKTWSSRAGHGVYISQYMEGYPNDVIEELAGEKLYDDGKDSPGRSTCGVNERTDVKCYESSHPTEYERAKAVARLVMGGGLCTAWRVGDSNHMFTNNHCMSTSSSVSSSESWFNYQNTTCNGSTLDTIVKVSGNTMFKTDYDLDYTLYSVNNFSNIQGYGNLGLDVRTPSAQEEIYIPQHGSGNPKELAITSDQNTGNVCRIDVAVANGRGTNTDTGYYCDTIGGSSGSPVLARSSHKVIALHHFGGCTNQGVRIDLIWPQVASYFNNQIPNGSGGTTPTNPNAAFSSSINGLDVDFTDNSTDDGTIVSRSWDFGDGGSSTATNPSHSYAADGTYTVTLTVTDNDNNTDSATAQVTVSSGAGVPYLSNGQSVSGLSGAAGEWAMYRVAIPAGASNLQVSTSSGDPDADLYVRYGAEPTTGSYDCRGYTSSSNESCTIASPQEGDYYIGVRAYSAYTALTLSVSWNEGSGGGDSASYPNLSASQGEWLRYEVVIPAGMSTFDVTLTGGSGDADLYVLKGAAPSTSSYDCRPYNVGNEENCSFTNPGADTWHIGIRAYSAFSGTTMSWSYE